MYVCLCLGSRVFLSTNEEDTGKKRKGEFQSHPIARPLITISKTTQRNPSISVAALCAPTPTHPTPTPAPTSARTTRTAKRYATSVAIAAHCPCCCCCCCRCCCCYHAVNRSSDGSQRASGTPSWVCVRVCDSVMVSTCAFRAWLAWPLCCSFGSGESSLAMGGPSFSSLFWSLRGMGDIGAQLHFLECLSGHSACMLAAPSTLVRCLCVCVVPCCCTCATHHTWTEKIPSDKRQRVECRVWRGERE
jgi:hypothetical protein